MANWLHQAQYSLVVFTLFIQMTVGAFWVLLVSDFLQRKAPDAIRDGFTRIGTTILLPISTIGLIFSATHLGRPQFALRALKHFETSWMSREIWVTGAFFALIALYTFLWWRRVKDAELRRLVGVLTGLVGAFAVVTQAMIYTIPGRPMWNHWSTLVLFAAAALTLGPLAIATTYSYAWGKYLDLEKGEETVRVSHRRLGITLLAGAGLYLVGLVSRLGYLSAGAAAAASTAGAAGKAAVGSQTLQTALLIGQQVVEQNGLLLNLEIGLSIGLPAVLAVLLWYLHRKGASLKLCNGLIATGLGLTLLGNLAGRALFYLSGRPWF